MKILKEQTAQQLIDKGYVKLQSSIDADTKKQWLNY